MFLAPSGSPLRRPGTKKPRPEQRVEADRKRQAPFSRLFNVAAIRSKSPRSRGDVFTGGRLSQGAPPFEPTNLELRHSFPCSCPVVALFLVWRAGTVTWSRCRFDGG